MSRQRRLLTQRGWRLFEARLRTDTRTYAVDITPGGTERLTARECDVVELAASGLKSHQIAERLSIASPTARGALRRSLIKLGLRSPTQLPLLWYALRSAPPVEAALAPMLATLSRAESDIVLRMLAGDGHRATASYRGTSRRTVANQMSRLIRRLGATSRLDLVARLIARAETP